MILAVLQAVSALAFLGYGLACLGYGAMEAEFRRYGLEPFRRWVGLLEVCGGAGLVAGFFVPSLALLASAGLAILMGMGVVVRWRLGDSIAQLAPAFTLGIINLLIFGNFLVRILPVD